MASSPIETDLTLPDDIQFNRLWRSCVAQAVRDLASENYEIAVESALWRDTPDFYTTCALAGIDAGWLSNEINQRLALKNPYRAVSLVRFAAALNLGLTGRTAPPE